MSAAVKLSSSALPGDPEVNGIDAIAAQLVDHASVEGNPTRCAIVWYDVDKITWDVDTDAHVPTIRARRIEDLGLLSDVPADVRQLAEKAAEKRTGKTPLPFDDVEVLAPDELGEGGE